MAQATRAVSATPITGPDDLGTKRTSSSALVWLGLAYLGFDAAYPKIEYTKGPLSISLSVALLLAALGWQQKPRLSWRTGRWYAPLSTVLGLWLILSGVAIWDAGVVYAAAAVALWFVFVIPGLASLMRRRESMHALLIGFAAGVSIFMFHVGTRLARGASVLDTGATGGGGMLLGVNRNAVNMRVLILVPFLVAGVGPRILRRVRWPLLALSAVWLVNSGGRSGLLGLAVVGLAFGLLHPGTSRRLKRILAVILLGLLAFTWIQTTTGQASVAADRLSDYLHGKRDDSDETRNLILRKAWHLAVKHPLWGVGYGKFEYTYDPVVEQASNSHVRNNAIGLNEHNTYAEFLGETGFAGLIAFIALLVALMLFGLTGLQDRYVRTITCSLAALAFVIFFHSALSVLLYDTIALLLAAGDVASAEPAGASTDEVR